MKYTPGGGYVNRCKDRIHHTACVEYGHHHEQENVVKYALRVLPPEPKKSTTERRFNPKRKKTMANRHPFVYHNVELVRVVDGDTVRLRVDVGFHLTFEENFRLADIDTPEVRGSEKVEGLKSKAALEQMIAEEYEQRSGLKIITYKEGKFGRWLVTLLSRDTGESLNNRMITEGHAKPYGK